jgi:hypothetical protein
LQANKLEVTLLDTTSEEDYNINGVLVSEGCAGYKIRGLAPPLPQRPKRVTVLEWLMKFTCK